MNAQDENLSVETQTAKMVADFTALVYSPAWISKTELSTHALDIVAQLLCKAGHDVGTVAYGRLHGEYRDLDGSRTGETYPINSDCPLKALAPDGKNNYRATEWLEVLYRRIRSFLTSGVEPTIAEKEILRMVLDSRPLPLIMLTSDGDSLRECDHGGSHTRDSHTLSSSAVGIHDCCHGFIDRRQISMSMDVLICRACYLRIPIPRSVKTYGDLRQYITETLGEIVYR